METVKEGRDYSFPEEEERILQLWDEIDAFHEQLRRSEEKPAYVFYDGPPFATGLPHYGHLLAGTLKVIDPWSESCHAQLPAPSSLPMRQGLRHVVRLDTCMTITLSAAGCCHQICHSNRALLSQTIRVSKGLQKNTHTFRKCGRCKG